MDITIKIFNVNNKYKEINNIIEKINNIEDINEISVNINKEIIIREFVENRKLK